MDTEKATIMLNLDKDNMALVIETIINNNNVLAKKKLIDVLKHTVIRDNALCTTIVDIALGREIPAEIPLGTTVKIDPEKTGWLSSDEKSIIQDNTRDGEIYGIIKEFHGYHGFSNYTIEFKEGKTIDLPTRAITSVKDVVI